MRARGHNFWPENCSILYGAVTVGPEGTIFEDRTARAITGFSRNI